MWGKKMDNNRWTIVLRNIIDTQIDKMPFINLMIGNYTVFSGRTENMELTHDEHLDLGNENMVFLNDKWIADIFINYNTLVIRLKDLTFLD